jgi:predicted metal-dependent phosphoesterase TrpH
VKAWCADLHIHTCLSPCAENEMTPPWVVREASGKGLQVIAICDHNSVENVNAVKGAARDAGLAVLGGIEINTREEVHVLGIFDDDRALESVQEIVYRNLAGENDPAVFGEQAVMDEYGDTVRFNEHLLIGATELSIEESVRAIHEHGGIAIASHIDRASYSVISQLGFIPKEPAFDGVEVCSEKAPESVENVTVVKSSDAHRPGEIGSRYTRFLLNEPSASEIGMALHRTQGRRVLGF